MTVAALGALPTLAMAAVPFYMIRLRAPETDSPDAWAETRQALADHPGCCDEVWFSTGIGYPTLDAHRVRAEKQAKAAEDCRRMGIAPGLQIQATVGHADSITAFETIEAMDWQGWTGSHGIVAKACSCPRDPRFIAYFEEVGRIYAAYRPSSVWIDDDLRIDNHRPATDGSLQGCWCGRCVADFSAVEGHEWTRESLAAAAAKDAALRLRWERFQFGSLAEFARRVTAAIHAVSPETRMGYQHCLRTDGLQTLVYRAMAEASEGPVRSRPGGGAYYDHDPHGQLEKAYSLAGQRASLAGAEGVIEQFCPEVESYPRTFACRTPRGVLLEAIENLALGMDSVSMLITDSRYEKMSWYGDTFFKALAANRACLKGYADANAGTLPCGLLIDLADKQSDPWQSWHRFAAGVPIVIGYGRAAGRWSDFVAKNGGKPIDVRTAKSADFMKWSRLADEVSGGKMPVVLDDPIVAFVMPRVAPDGTLKTVAVVNTTIGRSAPVRLRLRGVPAQAVRASWHALDSEPVDVSVAFDGDDAIAVLPPVEGWSAGWLGFK